MLTAAITLPFGARTGADTDATPASRSPTDCAQPRRRSGELGAAAGEDRLLAAAAPALAALRDATGESAQLYRRQGDLRICVAVAERLSGLRDSVPVGAALTMQAGSAAQILLAWEDSEKIHRGLTNARFTAAA